MLFPPFFKPFLGGSSSLLKMTKQKGTLVCKNIKLYLKSKFLNKCLWGGGLNHKIYLAIMPKRKKEKSLQCETEKTRVQLHIFPDAMVKCHCYSDCERHLHFQSILLPHLHECFSRWDYYSFFLNKMLLSHYVSSHVFSAFPHMKMKWWLSLSFLVIPPHPASSFSIIFNSLSIFSLLLYWHDSVHYTE